jgi:hypothetical protein
MKSTDNILYYSEAQIKWENIDLYSYIFINWKEKW